VSSKALKRNVCRILGIKAHTKGSTYIHVQGAQPQTLTCQRIRILQSEGYRLLIRLSNTFTQPSGIFSNETRANPF
jgi:hypothetical protein